YRWKHRNPSDAASGTIASAVHNTFEFINHMEMEYLPVYHPSEEERRNPRTYAHNVGQAIAQSLEIPVVPFKYCDKLVYVGKRPYETATQAWKDRFSPDVVMEQKA
ncbi:hypothetical protein KIPB_014101, partial [Kipferlia bialata]